MTHKPVALVVVSHSAQLAAGVVEIAEQMAPEVLLRAAGGTDDGRVGTSFDAVQAAVEEALATEGVQAVVLTADLGSAVMTAESVIDFADGDVRLAPGPVVEGTVAAAVQAQLGKPAEEVAAAATIDAGAAPQAGESPQAPAAEEPAQDAQAPEGEGLTRTFTLVNKQGLHARPAALLARTASEYDATVTINGVDATSILNLMSLNTAQGDEVQVAATGPQAEQAMTAVGDAITSGLGDL